MHNPLSELAGSATRRVQALFGDQKKCYRIENAASDEATVYVYDVISWWGVAADEFVRELAAVKAKTIHLRINSPGGNVFDAVAMRTALKEHSARIVTHVDGLAASAATVIADAGDEVRMADGAFFMIHNPWFGAVGDAKELRKAADLLDLASDSIAKIYAARTGKSVKEMLELMDAETWFTAEAAREIGFADQVESEQAAAQASFDLSVFAHVPAELAARSGAPERKVETIRDFEALLRDAGGFTREQAKAIAANGYRAASEPREEADGLADLVAALQSRAASLATLST